MRMTRETVSQLDTMIDHLTGEELGQALVALNERPDVLDAICLQAIGKKNRPAWLLQVLCRPANAVVVAEAIFMHTHTLGIRVQTLERFVLPRQAGGIETAFGPVTSKQYEISGQAYARPEADAAQKITARAGVGAPALRLSLQTRGQRLPDDA